MKNNYLYIVSLLCFAAVVFGQSAYAHGNPWAHTSYSLPTSNISLKSLSTPVTEKDSTSAGPKDSIKLKKIKAQQLAHLQQLAALRGSVLTPAVKAPTPPKTEEAPVEEEKVFRSFPSLDQQLAESQDFNVSFANRAPEFNEAYLAENFQQNPAVEKLINNAKGALDAVKELGNFVDIITGEDLLELPVGLKKTDQTSNNSVELAITEVKFTPGYALLKVWARLIIPEKGEVKNEKDRGIERELFFGAENVKLSYDGGLSGDMKLVLLGNQAIPIQGDNWLLTLKGGIDLKKNTFGDQSYIEFDCSDLKGISLEGDLRVSRNVLLPIDENGNYVCSDKGDNQNMKDNEKAIENKCYVGTSFSVKAEGWNDLLVNVDLPRFEVVGLQGWGFNLTNVVLDLSDSRNAPKLDLPKEYDQIYPGEDKKLWRGFYAEEVSVMLPKGIENTKKSNGRVEFGAKNLVLDSQGVSGTFYGENVLKTGDGAAGKWAFTIDDVSISLSRNSLTNGSIGGDIAVPIFEEPMDYEGYIAQNGYGLEVGLNSNYKTPVFLGEMQLERNSSVAIDVKEGHVYPSANLTGKLSVIGEIGQKEGDASPSSEEAEASGKGFSFPGIEFQELKLETEPGKKTISAESFGFTGEMKLMNFPASVENLELVTPKDQVGLSFDLKINLDGEGSHATTSMDIMGKLEDGAKIHKWKFEKVSVDGIEIDYTKANFQITGELDVMEDDPVYGNGFKGNLTANFKKLKFSAEGNAIFGNKDFRYWTVDIATNSIQNEGTTKLPIKAFVGGLSYKMQKVSGNSSGFEPGTAVYKPDANTGLGVRAGVKITTENADAFSCKAYLEMEFNAHGGLNRIGFMGEGAIMGKDESGPDDLKKSAEVAEKVDKSLRDNSAAAANKRYGNFMTTAKESIPIHDVAASGKVGVYVGIEKDFVNDTFDGEFELYLDLGAIKGGGANNLAGYAKIHTGPNDWYMYIGTPDQRIDLLFNSGVQVRVGGYFMTGTKLPAPGDISPHPIVTKILGDDMLRGERKDNQLTAGKGFAFGMNFGYGYDFDWGLFYAMVEIGAGFDVMHAYYPNAKCVGRPGPVGNNGWYSMGQVYAYLYGEFGVKVDLAFIKGNFTIAEAGVAAMLRGQFPNPVYIQGYVGMYYKILGGLVSGRMRMKVELGEECELENINDTIGVPMISDVTPRDGDDDVSVFAAPQAVFNYAANSDFTVDLEEGVRTFKLQLKNFTVTSEGKKIKGTLEWNDTNDAVTFKPERPLPSEQEVKVSVEVSFDEKIDGIYKTMTEDGKPVIEKKEISFVTDKAPDHIVWENVAYLYPVKEQRNFYPKEYKKGYVKMIQPQDNLFNKDFEIRAEFVSRASGQGVRTPVSYDKNKGTVFFDIPDLMLDAEYDLNLMVFPSGQEIPTEIVVEETELLEDEDAGDTTWFDPNTDTQSIKNTSASAVVANKKASSVTISNAAPKSIFDYTFKTSRHETFGKKIKNLNVTSYLTNPNGSEHSLSIKVADYEFLDELEVLGNGYTKSLPLVYAEAILNDSYYKKLIGPLLYNEEVYPLDRYNPELGEIRVDRDEDILGVPPVRSFYLSNKYKAHLMANDYSSSWVKNRIPFVYNLPVQYKLDMTYLKGEILKRYDKTDGNRIMFNSFKYLTERTFPSLPLGKYDAQLIYRTPGFIHKKGYSIKYRND
ncbi:hypothetical protein [Zobellia uliginosa]|uniref:hypothetical protein n=1 Tax=Zobellia uliginosa TaxID=143224 RepID=UPI0026E24D1B|nr:hypothetical protein [Zobellia uliginosa]MDO6515856.1 hypothetical protein [Zobellia uliginosa]